MPDIDGDDGAAGAPYVCSLPVYTMETQTTTWVQLCMHATEIARSQDCTLAPHNLEVA